MEYLHIKLPTNACKKVYRIEKEIITDPLRNTLLQKIKFLPLQNQKTIIICMYYSLRI